MASALLENRSDVSDESSQVVQPLVMHTAQLLGDLYQRINQSGQLLLSSVSANLSRKVSVLDENGLSREIGIPNERSLTIYLDKKEVITLMTLGQAPELLVLGYLRNQELLVNLASIASITVDWEVGAVAVLTHDYLILQQESSRYSTDNLKVPQTVSEAELKQTSVPLKEERRTVTSGCGQGSMFSHLMENVHQLHVPSVRVSQAQLFSVIDIIREHPSVYKKSGSVHACALFEFYPYQSNAHLKVFVEDVGRHNALDTIAGWMWLHDFFVESTKKEDTHPQQAASSHLLYTTGRLTSEMMIKSAQMLVPIVMSRSGTTEMGLQVAQQLGICAIGRAAHRRYLCFSAAEKIISS